MAEDDLWDSSDDDLIYDRKIAERTWERLQDEHGNYGFKEGITEGKEATLQQGFNEGYKEGSEMGRIAGKLRGIVNTLLTLTPSKYATGSPSAATLQELTDLDRELTAINFSDIFTKEYFYPEVLSCQHSTNEGGCAGACSGGKEGDACCKGTGAPCTCTSSHRNPNAIPMEYLAPYIQRVRAVADSFDLANLAEDF